MSKHQLFSEILKRSEHPNWDLAIYEWELIEILQVNEPIECCCGHWPIKELFRIHNTTTGRSTTVGSSCIKLFPFDLHTILIAFKRIELDLSLALNLRAINYCDDKFWLDEWSLEFYLNTYRKRKLSERQLHKRVTLNKYLVKKFKEPVHVLNQNDNRDYQSGVDGV